MVWRIVAIGKPKLSFALAGIEEYRKRVNRFCQVEIVYLRGVKKESEQLLAATRGTFRVVLDERGRNYSSLELAEQVRGWTDSGISTLSLLAGGAQGHDESVRSAADVIWSLSRSTLQHELALLLALEQVYRAYTINRGLPYHK